MWPSILRPPLGNKPLCSFYPLLVPLLKKVRLASLGESKSFEHGLDSCERSFFILPGKGPMPYRRRTARRRYAARSRRFRAFRRRRRREYRRKKKGPTTRTLARRVRHISRRLVSARKMFYTVAQNVLVENSSTFTVLGAVGANPGGLTNVPYNGQINQTTGLVYPQIQSRERDEQTSAIGSISLRMSVHASPLEGLAIQHYFIALVKCTNGAGSLTGINLPNPTQVWDPSDTDIPGSTSILPLWRLFKPNPAYAEVSKTLKFLKVWSGSVQPQGGNQIMNVDYGGLGLENNATPTQNNFVPNPPAPGAIPFTNLIAGNHNYTSTVPSYRLMRHTMPMKGKKMEFVTVQASLPLNEQYFLVALGNNAIGSGNGYRVNMTARTVFYSV